jgi:hypothetical protein
MVQPTTNIVVIARHDSLDYYPWSYYYNNTEARVAGALLLLLLLSLLVTFFFAYPYDARTEREIIYVDLEKGSRNKKGSKHSPEESEGSDKNDSKSSLGAETVKASSSTPKPK